MHFADNLGSLDLHSSIALAAAILLLAAAFIFAMRHIDGVVGTWPLMAVICVAWPVGLIALLLLLTVGGTVGFVALLVSATISIGILAGDLITERMIDQRGGVGSK